MWRYIPTEELYHYGVKGMKWGVRKRNPINTIKNKFNSRKDNNAKKPKSKYRTMVENQYVRNGSSQKEAEELAAKKIKIQKTLAVVGAITLTAAAAYVAHKHLKTRADGMIKAGKTLQRIEFSNEGKLHDSFYAAKDKSDKSKYAGVLGMTRVKQFGKAYVMNIGVDSDIKIAGNKQAQKVFEDLYKNDPEFREKAKDFVREHFSGKNAAGDNMKKMYENFNSALCGMNRDSKGKEASSIFYNSLKLKGYNAIRDINDMKFSGYKAKNPLIIFGASDKVSINNFREMGINEISDNLKKEGHREIGRLLTKQTVKGAVVSVAGSGLMYGADYLAEYENKIADKRADYLAEYENKIPDKRADKKQQENIA